MSTEIKYNPALLAGIVRKHFLEKLCRIRRTSERFQFILRSEGAWDSERRNAERWLAAHGYSAEQITAMRRR
jgi:hypothetical protein